MVLGALARVGHSCLCERCLTVSHVSHVSRVSCSISCFSLSLHVPSASCCRIHLVSPHVVSFIHGFYAECIQVWSAWVMASIIARSSSSQFRSCTMSSKNFGQTNRSNCAQCLNFFKFEHFDATHFRNISTTPNSSSSIDRRLARRLGTAYGMFMQCPDLCDKRKAEKERPCKAMNVSRVYYACFILTWFQCFSSLTLYIALDMNVKDLKLNLKLLEPDCALASARSRVRASAWIQPDCNDFKRLPLGIPRNFAHSHSRDFHETLM